MSFIVLDKTFDPVVKDWINKVGKCSNINAVDRCVKALRNEGILKELDLFHLIGGLDSDVQRLRPLITTSATKTFTAVASPTLDRTGVTGNGTTSYLNLNFVLTTNSIKYSLNSASLGVYSRTNVNEATADIGGNDGTPNRAYMLSRSTGTMQGYLNNNSNNSYTVADSLGLHCLQRTSSILTTAYKNGSSVGTNSGASVGLHAQSMLLCARNANGSAQAFSTRNLSMCFIGSGSFDQLKFYQIIQTYMSEVGLAV